MKLFLTLRHWQLFLGTWGLPLVLSVYSATNPGKLLTYFPAMMIFFVAGVYGWLWSIASVLHPRLPADVRINMRLVHVLFFIPTAYLTAAMVYLLVRFNSTPSDEPLPDLVLVIFPFVHVVSLVCIFVGLRYSAKIMKSVEIGRMARFADYVGEFFLMWFQPVGLWIVQPRLNKLMEEGADEQIRQR